MDFKIKIGQRIEELRCEVGVSQMELANLAGLDRTYITSVEKGKRNVSIVNMNDQLEFSDHSLIILNDDWEIKKKLDTTIFSQKTFYDQSPIPFPAATPHIFELVAVIALPT